MADGAYPIRSPSDVENAVRDYYRSGQKPEIKAHIIARAHAIGAVDALPEDWTDETEKSVAPIGALNAPEALVKAATALAGAAAKLDRLVEESARLRKSFADASPALAELEKRIAALEAQPMPAKAALRALSKTADGADGDADDIVRRLAAMPAEARALALTKLSLANPLRF